MGSGEGRGIVLRHALAEAEELWRRVAVNRQRLRDAADAMGLCRRQCRGVMQLLRKFKGFPSRERLASVVMRDPGLDDADVAEMFGKPVRWATAVRAHIDELRALEPVDERYEYVDEGLRPGDPTPDEIARQAAAIRAQWPAGYRGATLPGFCLAFAQPGMRNYIWDGNRASFVSVSAAKWTGR